MVSDINYWSKVLKRLFLLALTVIIILICFKLSVFYMPFLVSFVLALLFEPIIRLIMKKWKWTRRLSSIFIMVISILIIVGILVLCIALGYRRGLAGALLKLISFALALVIAFVLFKPVSNIIIDNTNWDESLTQGIREAIVSDSNEETTDGKENAEEQGMPTVIMEHINESVEAAGDTAKEAVADAAAEEAAIIIINAGVWIALFIIAKIALFFVKGIANLITKLPIIKQFDKLGGIIYGILEAIVVIYIILAIISFVSPVLSGSGIIEAIQDSFIGSIMYHNNLLLKIIF